MAIGVELHEVKTQILLSALLVTVSAVPVAHVVTLNVFAEQVEKKKKTLSLILYSSGRKSSLGTQKPVPEPSFHSVMQIHLLTLIVSMGQDKAPKGSFGYYCLKAKLPSNTK